MIILEIAAILLVCVMRVVQPRWSFVGAQLFVAVTAAAICYLVYASLQTFLGGLPILAVFASIILLILEILALGLSVSFTFEICDVLSRRTRQRLIPPLTREPWVALQVPTYNEPVEVVQPTLEVPGADRLPTSPRPGRRQQHHRSRAVEADRGTLCANSGRASLFVHLENWPGFKAGALNEATPRLPEEVEILGIVDADYQVHPQWLRNTIGYFDDPSVAFMQTSQHYREWRDNPYLRGLFYSFRYFFDITLIARSHRNAIIFCGTMGLIRRSAFNADRRVERAVHHRGCGSIAAHARRRISWRVRRGRVRRGVDAAGFRRPQEATVPLGARRHPDSQVPLAGDGSVRQASDAADGRAAHPLPARQCPVVRRSAHRDLHGAAACHGARDVAA